MSSQLTHAELVRGFESLKEVMFERYDVDDSGTLNTKAELLQLCTNLCVKLNVRLNVDFGDWVWDADIEEDPWDLQRFSDWFITDFIEKVECATGPRADDVGQGELPTIYNRELEDDDEYCWVIVLPAEEHERYKFDDEKKGEIQSAREEILWSITRAGLSIKKYFSCDQDEIILEIGAPQRFLEFIATQNRLPVKCQAAPSADGEVRHCYAAFDMVRRDEFIGRDQEGSFSFRSKPRIQLVWSLLTADWAPEIEKCGAGLFPGRLIKRGVVKHVFCKHGPSLPTLGETWARFGLIGDCGRGFLYQPIDSVRDYFGEKIAMYFAFLGFYTKALVYPTVAGIMTGIAMLAMSSNKQKAAVAQTLFAVFMCIWAPLFVEYWKREEACLSHHWGTRGLNDTEEPLPEFEGVYDKILETEVHDPTVKSKKMRQMCLNALLVAAALSIVAGTMVFYTGLQYNLQKMHQAGMVVSMVNAISIIVFNLMYKKLAAWLTEQENNRTETEFQDSLTIKCFLFQFVNSYFRLYCAAFLKPWAVAGHVAGVSTQTLWKLVNSTNGTLVNITSFASTTAEIITSPATENNQLCNWFGTCSCHTYTPTDCYDAAICDDFDCTNLPTSQCSCTTYDCDGDVGVLLLTLFGTQLFIGNLMEVLMPQIVAYMKARMANGDQSDLTKTQSEQEAEMANYEEFVYEGVFNDYNEMILQFGFVSLFASNFPIVGVLAFLNNIIEIRSDSYKFIHVFRRPTPRPCETIGAWLTVMEVMLFATITTNVATVFLVSNVASSMTWENKVGWLFIAEHLAYLIKFGVSMYIPDIPEEIQLEISYEECMARKAVSQDVMLRLHQEFGIEINSYRSPEATMDHVPEGLFVIPASPALPPAKDPLGSCSIGIIPGSGLELNRVEEDGSAAAEQDPPPGASYMRNGQWFDENDNPVNTVASPREK